MNNKRLIKLISFLFIFMISKEVSSSVNFNNFKFSAPGNGLIEMETETAKNWIFVVFSPEQKEIPGKMIVLNIRNQECFLTDGIWGNDISDHLSVSKDMFLTHKDGSKKWWIKLENNSIVTFGFGATVGENQVGILTINLKPTQNFHNGMAYCGIVIGNEKGKVKSIKISNLR